MSACFIQKIAFFYDLRIPIQRFTASGNHLLRLIGLLVEPLSRLFAAVLPRQCNEFAFVMLKTSASQPWIKASLSLHDQLP